MTAIVLLLGEFLPPDENEPRERRHIVSVFKLVQDLLAPTGQNRKNDFSQLMDLLPDTHKARWFAGGALDMAGLMIQNLSHELFAIADENSGKLKTAWFFTATNLELCRPSISCHCSRWAAPAT